MGVAQEVGPLYVACRPVWLVPEVSTRTWPVVGGRAVVAAVADRSKSYDSRDVRPSEPWKRGEIGKRRGEREA